jgi:hypothetical protein
MTVIHFLRRALLPLVAALVTLIVQPAASMVVLWAGAHHSERDIIVVPVWFILCFPSIVFGFFVRAVTSKPTVQVFGAHVADVYLGMGLNAVGWALVAGVVCFLIRKRLTRRCSQPLAGVRPRLP